MLSSVMYLNFFHRLVYLNRKMLLNCICKKVQTFVQCFATKIQVLGRAMPCHQVSGSRHLKANSHIACRSHAVPMPCRALIYTCHAVPLPCSDSSVSFVEVRVAVGNIRTASPTVQQIVLSVVCCYHSLQS
jgi:hypothetical protein